MRPLDRSPVDLKRDRILRGGARIAACFEGGRRFSRGGLTILVRDAPAGELPPGVANQAAFCVGRTHGKAVERNRRKRILRELFRHAQAGIESGHWLAFLPAPGFYHRDQLHRADILRRLIEQAGIAARPQP